MEVLQNLDLFAVGIAIAGIGVLGFSVFFNNKKSITGRSFLYFSLLTIMWSAANYLAYQVRMPEISFWLFRIVIAIGVWHSFFFFQMSYVFPRQDINFPKWYKFILIPVVSINSILNLTPLVFSNISSISPEGRIAEIENGPAIALFGIVIAFLVLGGITQFLRKTLKAQIEERKQFRFVSAGIFITFLLLMIFNFILPAFFDNPNYIPLGAVFIFPYIAFTSYAIIRHRLLNVKIIATEVLAFVLAVVTLYEVIISEGLLLVVLRSGIFLLVFSLSILLIRSVRKEVEQRERLEVLTKELEAANVKLQELDKLKSEFLSFASHQVKSPMAVVKGFAELIADGTYGEVSDEAKEKAKKIKDNANRTIALVNNLLDMRKIEEGKMEFRFGRMDIAKMLREMAEEYRVIGRGKGLDIQFEASEEAIVVNGDEEKLRQVFQNLIDNSIKYTDKGYVCMSVKREQPEQRPETAQQHSNILENVGMSAPPLEEGGSVVVTIQDSGRGMSKELQAKLFQQFVRDEKTKREVQGTGLGLFIAKQIVEAHKGSISTFSAGEGMGSAFTVRLGKG